MQHCSYVLMVSAIPCKTAEKLGKHVIGPIIENNRVWAQNTHISFSIPFFAIRIVKLIQFSNFGHLKPPSYENQESCKTAERLILRVIQLDALVQTDVS